jgi:multiple sugar transport system substrate-binding protein
MQQIRSSRRALIGSASALAAGILVACGASGGAGATGGGGSTANQSKQPVSLTFESYASGGSAGGQINEFENWKQALDRGHQKYPWITVDATFVGNLTPGSYDRWTAAMAAGNAPSIMEFETKRMASFAEKGTLLDLTPYSAKSKVARKEDFIDADWDKTLYKGKQWIMLAMSKPAVFFYNSEVLKRAGVNDLTGKWGDPAWTWDAFVQVCKKVMTSGAAPFGFGQSTWWVYQQPFLWSNGGDFVNKDRTGGATDQPASLEALQRMADLNLKDKAMNTSINNPGDAKFENGKVAIYHVNSGNWLGYGQVPDLKWNIAPIPTGKQGTLARNPPNGFAAYSGEKHRDETWLMIEELVQPDSLRNIEGVPDRKAQAEAGDFAAAKFLQGIGGRWQVFIDAKKNSRDEPSTQYFQDLDKTLNNGAINDALWKGQMSVKDWAMRAKEKVDAVLQGKGPQDW